MCARPCNSPSSCSRVLATSIGFVTARTERGQRCCGGSSRIEARWSGETGLTRDGRACCECARHETCKRAPHDLVSDPARLSSLEGSRPALSTVPRSTTRIVRVGAARERAREGQAAERDGSPSVKRCERVSRASGCRFRLDLAVEESERGAHRLRSAGWVVVPASASLPVPSSGLKREVERKGSRRSW